MPLQSRTEPWGPFTVHIQWHYDPDPWTENLGWYMYSHGPQVWVVDCREGTLYDEIGRALIAGLPTSRHAKPYFVPAVDFRDDLNYLDQDAYNRLMKGYGTVRNYHAHCAAQNYKRAATLGNRWSMTVCEVTVALCGQVVAREVVGGVESDADANHIWGIEEELIEEAKRAVDAHDMLQMAERAQQGHAFVRSWKEKGDE